MNENNEFFTGDNDSRSHLTASINFTSDAWLLYATGYRNAANMLVNGIDKGFLNRSKIDTIVYPVAFMYRHSVELWLKQMLFVCKKLLDSSNNASTVHSLVDLWRALYQAIQEVHKKYGSAESQEDKQYIEAVSRGMYKIDAVDKASAAFRYPIDKDKVPYLQSWTHLNVGQLSDVFNELLDNLEALSMWLRHIVEPNHNNETYDQL